MKKTTRKLSILSFVLFSLLLIKHCDCRSLTKDSASASAPPRGRRRRRVNRARSVPKSQIMEITESQTPQHSDALSKLKILAIPDDFVATKCTSRDALFHSFSLLEEMALSKYKSKQIPFYNSKSTNYPSPAIMSTPFTESKFKHHFILHAAPTVPRSRKSSNLGVMRDCFNMDYVQYDKSLSVVTIHSQEFVAGCTPFREKAIVINKFRRCLTQVVAKNTENSYLLDSDRQNGILKKISHKLATSSTLNIKDHINASIVKVLLSDDYPIETLVSDESEAKNLARLMVDNCMVSKSLISDENTVIHGFFPKIIGDALPCISPQSGGSGMLSHGLDPHGMNWLDHNSTVLETCDVHPVCARLATEKILNFGTATYDKFLPSIRLALLNIWDTSPKLEDCHKATTSNCRYHTACWKAALKHVCKEHSFCCPSYTVYRSCASNIDSEACNNSICDVTSNMPES